jgi:hypothetical protein
MLVLVFNDYLSNTPVASIRTRLDFYCVNETMLALFNPGMTKGCLVYLTRFNKEGLTHLAQLNAASCCCLKHAA